LESRTVQAEALDPVLKAFSEEPGREKVKRTLFKAGHEDGRRYGRRMAERSGSATLKDLVEEVRSWGPGWGLEAPIRLPDGFQGSAGFSNLTDALVRRGDADAEAGQITGGA